MNYIYIIRLLLLSLQLCSKITQNEFCKAHPDLKLHVCYSVVPVALSQDAVVRFLSETGMMFCDEPMI